MKMTWSMIVMIAATKRQHKDKTTPNDQKILLKRLYYNDTKTTSKADSRIAHTRMYINMGSSLCAWTINCMPVRGWCVNVLLIYHLSVTSCMKACRVNHKPNNLRIRKPGTKSLWRMLSHDYSWPSHLLPSDPPESSLGEAPLLRSQDPHAP